MSDIVWRVSIALYAQPDAKLANGIFWTEFWVKLALQLWEQLS